MKKALLLTLPALLLLGACGGSETSSSTSTSTSTSTSASESSSSSSSKKGPVTADITISLTVSGIETYEGNHSTIWMNADALGSATEWGTYPLVQDENNKDLWTIVIENFELEQSISYNFYYGTNTSANWADGKNVSDTEYRVLVTEENVTSYDLTADFLVGTDALEVEVVINPVIKTTPDTTEDFKDTTYVWAWSSVEGTEVRFEKQSDGTWSRKFSIYLVDGIGAVNVTPVLGTADAADWNYRHGGWNGSSWESWDKWECKNFTEEVTTETINITFNGQPA